MKAKHPRFEVECIAERTNYTLVYDAANNIVEMYDTSRGAGNRLIQTFGPDRFPYDYKTAEEYYDRLYDDSLKPNPYSVYFLGYVDAQFEPIEPEDAHDNSGQHS